MRLHLDINRIYLVMGPYRVEWHNGIIDGVPRLSRNGIPLSVSDLLVSWTWTRTDGGILTMRIWHNKNKREEILRDLSSTQFRVRKQYSHVEAATRVDKTLVELAGGTHLVFPHDDPTEARWWNQSSTDGQIQVDLPQIPGLRWLHDEPQAGRPL